MPVLKDALWFCAAIVLPYFVSLFLLSQFVKKLRKDSPASPNLKEERLHLTTSPNFKPRPSQFDDAFHSDGEIMRSKYHGLFNLLAIASVFFVASHHVRHLVKEGTIWGFRSFIAMFERPDILGVWIGLLVIACLAYPLQLFFVKYEPNIHIQRLLHTLLVAGLLIWVISMVWLHPGWPLIPTGSLCSSMMVIMMKVHSYLFNNRVFASLAKTNAKKGAAPSTEKGGDKQTISQAQNKGPKVKTLRRLAANTENDSTDSKAEDGTKSPFEPSSADSPNARRHRIETIQYPENVTFWNWLDFMMVPTLVYDIHYPRTKSIRILYVLEKIGLVLGIMTLLHLISQYYIVPALLRAPDESAIESVAELIIPFFGIIMLIFYLIFDCICNGFAELTCFADREFYKDWWNSTTMDEFARTWNIPVHKWLLHHVYLESLQAYKISRHTASLITFLVSSLLHELVMILCFRMFTPFLFFSQLLQIPLIMFGRDLKGTRIGNCFFWFGLLLGVPLLSVLYCREYYTLLRVQCMQE